MPLGNGLPACVLDGRGKMIWLAIISLLLGAVLAQRFRVFVLLPATSLVLAAAAGAGLAEGDTPWWILLMAIGGVASLQVGYFIGLGLRQAAEAPVSQTPGSFTPSTSSARNPAR
jgi:hypothetical protein